MLGIWFLIDIKLITGTVWPGTIIDSEEFNFISYVNFMTQFIFLPIVFFYNFHIIKSKLAKEGYKIDDKLRNNLGEVFYSVGIGLAAVIVIRLIFLMVSP